ncbi:MAG: YihA family ribosome biogenesis GTP-binding protein [SAR324 cluster bacterium]|nr:YihA family ribosome biogenesis GTP-binding protein [SAR324 cluster bacterium]
MKIISAELLQGAANASQFPVNRFHEIAFAGKSNVGKSTLINSLLNRKNLVKTSSTPGKTQQINFFLINQAHVFVDLPGYGFAKVPASVKKQWQALIEIYLSTRVPLRGIVLIIDVRHGPTELDLQMKHWLDHYQRPVLVVANKIDKLKSGQRVKHLKQIQQDMQLPELPIPHSSLENIGKKEIWSHLSKWLRPDNDPDLS